MINWKDICESRCAIDSCYDWLEQNLTDIKLIKVLTKLGFKEQTDQICKYIVKYRHKDLRKNMRSALRRNKC